MLFYIAEGHDFLYEVQTTIQIFYQNESYKHVLSVQNEGITIVSRLADGLCYSQIYIDGIKIHERFQEIALNETLSVKRSVFFLLQEVHGISVPWGIMTGIRPAKKIRRLMEIHTVAEIENILRNDYLLREDKISLLVQVAQKEFERLKHNDRSKISLYVGIPFCPTKCLYCSFTSYPIQKHANIVESYLRALYKELEYVGSLNYDIENIYIGGGTPTSLNSVQLEGLLSKMDAVLKKPSEFTVECGRPDTLDIDKLKILKDYGVTRISINPQTLNQKTLDTIGRGHSSDDIFKAFELAREAGHNNINADIIVGLPGETVADVAYTLGKLKLLDPENITVHTLAIKRGSALKDYMSDYNFSKFEEIESMLTLTEKHAKDVNMTPYYMYRQKNMLGNFENIAYSKPGYECMYNVQIMEEDQNIIAVGAGAVTKVINFETDKICRVFNHKSVEHYIDGIDNLIERKRELNNTNFLPIMGQ